MFSYRARGGAHRDTAARLRVGIGPNMQPIPSKPRSAKGVVQRKGTAGDEPLDISTNLTIHRMRRASQSQLPAMLSGIPRRNRSRYDAAGIMSHLAAGIMSHLNGSTSIKGVTTMKCGQTALTFML